MKKRFKILRPGSGGCPIRSAEAGQIGLLRRAQETTAAAGCPIDFQQAAQFAVLPEGRADEREQPGEAVRPLAQVSTEAQQDIRQQGDPDLPAVASWDNSRSDDTPGQPISQLLLSGVLPLMIVVSALSADLEP